MLLRILAPLLILAVPMAPGAQQLPTVVVPLEAGVAIAARGQAQPRLAARPAARRPAAASRGVRSPSPFEAESAADPLTAAGPATLPLLGAAALAAAFGGGGSGSGTGAVATTRTR
jgi:hypothetical protein